MIADTKAASKILHREVLPFEDRSSHTESCLIQAAIYLVKRPAILFVEAGVVEPMGSLQLFKTLSKNWNDSTVVCMCDDDASLASLIPHFDRLQRINNGHISD